MCALVCDASRVCRAMASHGLLREKVRPQGAIVFKAGPIDQEKEIRNMSSTEMKKETNSTSSKRVMSSKSFATINPSTGEEIETFSFYGQAQIEKTLALAEQSFQTWRRISAYKRAQYLSQLAEALRKNKPKLATV